MCQKITPLFFIRFSAIVAGICLASALIAEHFFTIAPCHLCYYERYFYQAIIWGGILGSSYHLIKPDSSLFPAFLFMGLVLIGGTGLGIYHLGVEEHWWQGTAACRGIMPKAQTLEEYRQALFAKPPIRCDKVNWRIFGISATWLNLAWFVGFFLLWVCVGLQEFCKRKRS